MITGIHNLIYSDDPEADRAFIRDVLGFPHIDAHDGWLIFALPPAELGVHPPFEGRTVEMYLMCDELEATMAKLREKGVEFVGEVEDDKGVGRFATLRLPGGGTLGLYQPVHATPLDGYPGSRQPA